MENTNSDIISPKESRYYIFDRQMNKRLINKNEILSLIIQKSDIGLSVYDISKITKIAYPQIHAIIREFKFCGLIKTQDVPSKNNSYKQLIFPANKQEEKKE